MIKGKWNGVLYNWNIAIANLLVLRQISEHLQDAVLTKLLESLLK